MAAKKLGEMLLEKGLIDRAQLETALGRQRQWGGRLGVNLVRLGFISEITLLRFLSSQLDFPCADLAKVEISKGVCNLVPKDIVKKFNVMPLQAKEKGGKKYLYLAMADPTNIMAIDEIRFRTGLTVKPVLATDSQISKAIEKYYGGRKWTVIEPLQEKVPPMEREMKMEIFYDVPADDSGKAQKEYARTEKNPQLLALIRLLVKKGIIGKEEYARELKQIKEHQ